ncbi:MAG: hypothetical protein Q9207_007688, partial [Kuettlingeria erythrocarpa]
VYTPTSQLRQQSTYAPPRLLMPSPPSPPPLASPLESPFPLFPSPSSAAAAAAAKEKKKKKAQAQVQEQEQEELGHGVPTRAPAGGAFGAFGSQGPLFGSQGSPRRVLRSLSRGRSGVGAGVGKKRHVYRRIEGSGLGTVSETIGGDGDVDVDGREGCGGGEWEER